MKKYIALLLALLTLIGMLAGCAKDETPDTPVDPAPGKDPGTVNPDPGKDPGTVTPPPVEDKYFKYYYVRSGEETTLNPHGTNLNADINVIDNCAGMLYGYVPKEDKTGGMLAPIFAAEVPKADETGLIWTIKLREDAKWSTGEPINADTWVYSFKMAIDPNRYFGVGANVASNYIDIKNAKDYYNSVAKENGVKFEDVGFKKADDYTLTIECTAKYTAEEVMRHFYLRYGACVYEPIYEKCISADGKSCDYGSSLDKIKFAGKFYIESWQKAAEIVFKKNDNWPLADMIHIDEVQSRVVGDESTRVELFEKGEASSIDLGTNGMAKYGEDPRVLVYGSKTIHTIEVNQNSTDPVKAALLNDPEFRQALFYATDRNAIAKLKNNTAAPYFLSDQGQILDDGTLYRFTPEAQALVEKWAPNGGYDPTKAKTLFDKVMAKNNLNKISINMLYTEGNEGRRVAAEYLDAQWGKIFGEDKFDLVLSAMPSSTLLKTMQNCAKTPTDSYDLGWSGMGLAVESYYPWRKFERYTGTHASRYGAYKNTKMEALLNECYKDENRMSDRNLLNLTVQMEEAMYEDMTCIPVYAGINNVLYQENIQLPVTAYSPGLGYGWTFSTLK